jgi:hypothetical protein
MTSTPRIAIMGSSITMPSISAATPGPLPRKCSPLVPFDELRAPLLTNLRTDPFERAGHEDAMGYQRWYLERMYAFAPASAYVAQWLQSFRDFPLRQKPGSFNLDRVMEAVTAGSVSQRPHFSCFNRNGSLRTHQLDTVSPASRRRL